MFETCQGFFRRITRLQDPQTNKRGKKASSGRDTASGSFRHDNGRGRRGPVCQKVLCMSLRFGGRGRGCCTRWRLLTSRLAADLL